MPRAFINSEFAKHRSNLVTSISVTVEHLAITCTMDVKKIFCKQSSYVQNYIMNVSLIIVTNHLKRKKL
jgi:hypothetical protein